MVAETISIFRKEFRNYRDYEERMGNSIKFFYNYEDKTLDVYSEAFDCYDGYDDYGSPYYWSYICTYENVKAIDFAEMICFYLYHKQEFDEDNINCIFTTNK